MKKLKIAVYAICKNEEKFVDRWMDSVEEADVIVVADTGSLDQTVEKLKAREAQVYQIKVDPWRFDIARNISLHLVPEDVDVCVCTDLDEVFEPGWRAEIEKAWVPELSRLHYKFTWGHNMDKDNALIFWKEKIHRRHGFRWIHPVHEVLEYQGNEPYVEKWEPNILLYHYPDIEKSRGSYLPLLELSTKEDSDDDRNMHYLGREYMFYGMWDKCIQTLKKHLEMPGATWKDERCASMRFIAKSYKEKGDFNQARYWLYLAIAEAPHLRDAYGEMARLAYFERDWPRVFFMVEAAMKIKERSSSYIFEAFCWDHTLYDLGALSSYELGMLDRALAYAKVATEKAPYDERLKNNLRIIEEKRLKEKGDL